jgi:hypothetical protein
VHRVQVFSARDEYVNSFSSSRPSFLTTSFLLEIVLCTLLNEFEFTPAEGKDIEWKMTGIVTPSVAGMTGPQLPLVISPVD